MKIYKFGGASVSDVKGVKNLAVVLNKLEYENTILVISAMGKMTNAFEKIVANYLNNDLALTENIAYVKKYHSKILNGLFINPKHKVYNEINQIWIDLSSFLIENNQTDYDYVYDQIVSKAELISTLIVSNYLNSQNISNEWIDSRQYIITDSTYREAKVNWKLTKQKISILKKTNKLIIAQGFIASGDNHKTTTLGREGSDYTAAIYAYCLDAKNVTIFKDVNGVLNANPKLYDDTILLDKISYKEAIEMAFYGASVIHPKTLQPLQNKEIPLYVKSFINPLTKGTLIEKGVAIVPKIPCYIVKNNQILISISTRNFSFMMEKDISEIFNLLHHFKLRVNLIQNTAISFSVCLEDKFNNFNHFLTKLKLKYKGLYNTDVTLLTIRHFNKIAVDKVIQENEILLQQTTRETVQFVVKTI